ncbi:MAG: efflux RND transporter periplasmic adaptor subunit [Janthinobacterium lividum]
MSRSTQLRIIVAAIALIVVIFALAALVHGLSAPDEVPPEKLPPGAFRPTADQFAQLKVMPVSLGSDAGSFAATGTISVDEDHSTPVLLPFSGQVAQVYVQAGQHVVRGQPLLRIASPEFVEARNTLFAANAQHATAAAQLRTAADTEKRQAAIFQTAGGAQKDYRQSQGDLVAAQSAMRSADAALGAARDKLSLLGKTPDEVRRLEMAGEVAGIYSETVYHAPVDGIVATRDVAQGQYVSAGGDKPVMTIADLGRVWLIAQLAESDAASVHIGDPVEVTTPAYPGRVFHAVIDNIGASLDPVTHRLPVRATVGNTDLALKPAMFATFAIERHRNDQALLIPSSAVIHEGDNARVWVLGPDHLLYARPVVVADSGDGQDKITSGLKRGERIVTQGAIFVNQAGLGE